MRSHAEQVFFFLFFCEISWTCSFSLHCEIRAWIHDTHWHQIWPLCVAASTLSRRRTDSRSVLRAALARECSSGIRPFGWSDVFIARVGRGTSQQQRIGSAPPCLRGCLHINLCECVRGECKERMQAGFQCMTAISSLTQWNIISCTYQISLRKGLACCDWACALWFILLLSAEITKKKIWRKKITWCMNKEAYFDEIWRVWYEMAITKWTVRAEEIFPDTGEVRDENSK